MHPMHTCIIAIDACVSPTIFCAHKPFAHAKFSCRLTKYFVAPGCIAQNSTSISLSRSSISHGPHRCTCIPNNTKISEHIGDEFRYAANGLKAVFSSGFLRHRFSTLFNPVNAFQCGKNVYRGRDQLLPRKAFVTFNLYLCTVSDCVGIIKIFKLWKVFGFTLDCHGRDRGSKICNARGVRIGHVRHRDGQTPFDDLSHFCHTAIRRKLRSVYDIFC